MKDQSKYKMPTYFTGIFEAMTPPVDIEKEGRPMKRSLITVVTEDGQKGFFEARDRIINLIADNNITIGDKVMIGFVFIGSEKEDRKYNNIFINEIEIVTK